MIHFVSSIYGGLCIWEAEDFRESQTGLGHRENPVVKNGGGVGTSIHLSRF